MTSTPQIEMRPLGAISLDEQFDLFGRCFEKPADGDWYRWKHVEGPWGPSEGVVAFDALGPQPYTCAYRGKSELTTPTPCAEP